MIETLIKGLIGLCLLVACVFLVLWVLAELGIVLPALIIKIIWIVVVLVALLFLWRAVRGMNWTL